MYLIPYLGDRNTASKEHFPPPNIDMQSVSKNWKNIMADAAAPPRGPKNARYTLVEFGDFQCPQCGRAKPVVDQLLATYPDKINEAFVQVPLDNIHQFAMQAAVAAAAAQDQGKFWPMFDTLYQNQANLESDNLDQYAQSLGLDLTKFEEAMSAPAEKQKVLRQRQLAHTIGIASTPTFFVHDNVTGQTLGYLGLDGNKKVKYPQETLWLGVNALAANPPWTPNAPISPSPPAQTASVTH
jgi:protein-disulfide isomerase